MIYLLLGKDDFSKKEFISELKSKENLQSVDYFYDWDEQQILAAFNNASLFDKKKIVVVYDPFGKFDFEAFLQKVLGSANKAPAANTLVFVQENLDRRKTETKKILQNKNLKVIEFEIPLGLNLRKWVEQRAKKINLKFEKSALDAFLQRIGIESERGEVNYDLWQVSAELDKLKTFVGERAVEVSDVSNLIAENINENIFKITNAIADKNRRVFIKLMDDYIEHELSGDEKAKIISLSGILAEQFRGILIIQNFLAEKFSDSEILKLSGYSPGKLFIYKKIARNFEQQKIFDCLRKLELLDQEIKTSNSPAALQFFMIISSVMS
jgi:DNA polymerase-3 subunit delta